MFITRGRYIYTPSLDDKDDKDDKNDKESEKSHMRVIGRGYGNLVIVVILVMEGVSRAALCPTSMHHRHAVYDFKRVTGRL